MAQVPEYIKCDTYRDCENDLKKRHTREMCNIGNVHLVLGIPGSTLGMAIALIAKFKYGIGWLYVVALWFVITWLLSLIFISDCLGPVTRPIMEWTIELWLPVFKIIRAVDIIGSDDTILRILSLPMYLLVEGVSLLY